MPRKSSRATNVAKIVHDISLATWFGGSLFGKFVLNPAVKILGSEEERGKVTNNAWARYKLVNLFALGGAVLGWTLGLRPDEDEIDEDERTAVRVKDMLLGAAAASSLGVTGVGARFSNRASRGAVPVLSGTRPSRKTPRSAAVDQKLLGTFENVELLALVGVIGLSSVLSNKEEEPPEPASLFSRLRGSRRR